MTNHSSDQLLPFSSTDYKEQPINIDDIFVSQQTVVEPTTPAVHSSFLLILITAGAGEIVINNLTYSVKEGTFLWLFPYHTYFLKTVTHPLNCLVFKTTLNVLMYASVSNDTNQSFISQLEYNDVPLVQTDPSTFSELNYLFSSSLTEYRTRQSHFELVLLGNLYKIIASFSRIREQSKPLKRKQKNNAWVIYQYLHYHFSEDLNITAISHQFKLSANEINASLVQLTGNNFRDNLTAIRMMNARSMMRFSGLAIDFIAKFVGYQSTPSFNRQFKKLTGLTPKEFRHQQLDTTLTIHFKQSTPFNILQYLFEHYSEPLTSVKIAQVFYSNSAAINQLLYDEFGYNFSQLLIFVRMIFAKNFVVLTGKKIIDICSFTGYNSLRSFNRHFKEVWHESPSVYREKYGSGAIGGEMK